MPASDDSMQVFNFCRSKCHKNFKMKRNPRKVRWTKAYRKLAGKELAEDTTFELERRRNRPEKYDREVVQKTLKAIGKIEAIKSKRQERFYEGRMHKAKLKEKKAIKVQLEKEVHLIKAPKSLTKEKEKLLAEAKDQRNQGDSS